MINFSIFDFLFIFSFSFIKSSNASDSCTLTDTTSLSLSNHLKELNFSNSKSNSKMESASNDPIHPTIISHPSFGNWKKYNGDSFDLVYEIDSILLNIGFNFTKHVIEIVVDYINDEIMLNVYHRIMDKLKLYREKRKELNFYNESFLKNLDSILMNEQIRFSLSTCFWMDIIKLFFKHIIYLKKKLIDFTKDELAKASEDIKSIISIIDERFSSKIISSKFDLRIMNINDFNPALLNSEFLDYSNYLAYQFANVLKYFYSPVLSKEKEIERVTCEIFKNRFFENGNPDTDILLKFFIMIYDFRGGMIKECLESNTQPDYSKISEESIKEIGNDIDKLRESRNIKHLIENFDMRQIRNPLMNST